MNIALHSVAFGFWSSNAPGGQQLGRGNSSLNRYPHVAICSCFPTLEGCDSIPHVSQVKAHLPNHLNIRCSQIS